MILNLVCPKCSAVVTKAEKEKLVRNLGKKIKCKSCNDAVVVAKINMRKPATPAPPPKKDKPLSKKEQKIQAKRNKKLTECKDCGEMMSKSAKKCPHCGAKKKGGCLTVVFASIIVIFVIGMLAQSGGENQPQSSSAPQNKVVQNQTAIPVTAAKLFNAYESNEIKADNDYKGKLLDVSGIVGGIDSGLLGQAIVTLETSNPFMSVSAEGNKAFTAAAAQLSKGQKIVLTCIGDGEVIGLPQLKDCKIK